MTVSYFLHGCGQTRLLTNSTAELPGAFALWASTAEARFLHGRFVWAAWDIEEYSKGELRKWIEDNVDILRIGVVGLRGGLKG